jgi:hypothetical protein
MPLSRVVHKSHSFAEAEEWDITQHISLTPEQRQAIARELKRRCWGENPPDVRSTRGQ